MRFHNKVDKEQVNKGIGILKSQGKPFYWYMALVIYVVVVCVLRAAGILPYIAALILLVLALVITVLVYIKKRSQASGS